MTKLVSPTAKDADRIAVFAERVFTETFGPHNTAGNLHAYMSKAFAPAKIKDELSEPSRRTTLALDGDQLAGFTQILFDSKTEFAVAEKTVELVRLYVDSNWHGQGIAKLLLRHAIEQSKAAGCKKIWLGVWEHNARACAFYRKHDFREAGSHVFQMGDDGQRDLIMVKDL